MTTRVDYRPSGSLGRALLLLQRAEVDVISESKRCTEPEAARLHELQLKIARGIGELREIASEIASEQ